MQILKMEFNCNAAEAESIMQEYLSKKVNGVDRFKFKADDPKYGKVYSFGLILKALFGTRYANFYYDKDGNKVSQFGFAKVKVHGVDVAFKDVERLSEIAYKIDGNKITIYFRYDRKYYYDESYRNHYNIHDLHEELIDRLYEASRKYMAENGIAEVEHVSAEQRINGDGNGAIEVYYDEIKNKTGIIERIN